MMCGRSQGAGASVNHGFDLVAHFENLC